MPKKSAAKSAEQQPDVAPMEADAPAQLQIGDIEAAVKVIDFASDQGAFKGWQVIQEVLILRNRLVNFVQSVNPPSAELAEEVPESPASAASA